MLSWSSRVNCYKLRLAIYIQVLVFTVLLFRDQKEAIYSLLPTNRWLDQDTKQYNKSVPQSICQLEAK